MAQPAWPPRFPGFLGVWVDSMRAYVDAHPSSAAPGAPVVVTLAPVAQAFGDNHPSAVPNADGSVSLRGGFVLHGPQLASAVNVVALTAPFLPARLLQLPVAAILIADGLPTPASVSVGMTTGGTVSVMVPALVDGDLLEVWLDAVTYWPASA